MLTAGILRVVFFLTFFAPVAAAAQLCSVASNLSNIAAPSNAKQLIYSPTYSRLVLRNSGSAITTINLGTGNTTTHLANSTFADMAISPSGRYVFAADYGGENIGYGTPGATSFVHRLDLSNDTWETKTAYIAGGIQAVSDTQVILKSKDQWVTFTNNSWGTGSALVPLNTSGGYYAPGYYAVVYYGDFRYDANTARLLHGNSGLSSQEIQAFRIVANDFVKQEGSGMYGSAQAYGGSVALATDGSAFYYGRLQVDSLDVTHNLRVFPESIYAATGNTAFGNGKYFDAHTGNLAGSLGFDATVYALNPNGDDFWTFDASQNLLRHFTFTSAACPIPPAPVGVGATRSPGTTDIVINWTAISGAAGYNLYMANQMGVTKANYASLPGGLVRANVISPYVHADAAMGTYYVVVTAFNDAGESVESAQVSITVPDTQMPSVPTGLTAAAVSGSRIRLSWTASTDNVGVSYYRLNRGGAYHANVSAPAVSFSDTGLTGSTPYSYSVAACDAANNCSQASNPASATTLAAVEPFLSVNYAPLADNATVSYLEDGTSSTYAVLPGTTIFNGVSVKQIQDSDNGSINYATNDTDGYREHGYHSPSVHLQSLGNVPATLTLNPPLKHFDRQFFLDQTVNSWGSANFNYQGVPSFSLNYSSTVTPVAFETVSVPAGTFSALRVDRYLRMNGSIGSTSVDMVTQGSEWWVNGLGLVKSVSTSTDGSTSETSNQVLTDSSLLDVSPAPFSFVPQGNVARGTQVASNTITVQGINAGVAISISGGQYSIDGGAFTSTPGTVFQGQTVAVRQTASTNYGTTTNATLTIGGVSTSFSATTLLLADTQVPTVPAGLTAAAVSGSQINLAWNASSDNVGVTAYQVFRGGVLRATVSALATSFSDTGLDAATPYSYTLAACDAAGNCSAQAGSAAATTLASGQYRFEPKLEPGFNLISNVLDTALDVAAIFGNHDAPVAGITAKVLSVWKWDAVNGHWAFHSPQLSAAANAAYAAAHQFDVLSVINPGEGYWLNSVEALALPAQVGTGFNWSSLNFAALPSGFNLIATANGLTPSEFNALVSAAPPQPGVVPTGNLSSLWAWDVINNTWFFYSPLLESSGGLPAVKNYADSHFFRHFQDHGKTLGPGVGFWINKL